MLLSYLLVTCIGCLVAAADINYAAEDINYAAEDIKIVTDDFDYDELLRKLALVPEQDIVAYHELVAKPDRYKVYFHANHTHSQHWQTIGVDLSHTQHYYHIEHSFIQLHGYGARLDKALLDLIEADPGVDEVEPSYWGRPVWAQAPKRMGVSDGFLSTRIKHFATNVLKSATNNLQMVMDKLNAPECDFRLEDNCHWQ